jgi:hypothetical protein
MVGAESDSWQVGLRNLKANQPQEAKGDEVPKPKQPRWRTEELCVYPLLGRDLHQR